jgi:hypothetical protein
MKLVLRDKNGSLIIPLSSRKPPKNESYGAFVKRRLRVWWLVILCTFPVWGVMLLAAFSKP